MTTLELLQKEFRDELVITKRVLNRVPEDKLTWKPHPRSMTLGQLALHIALVPGDIAAITQPDIFDVSTNTFTNPQPHTLAEIHFALNHSAHAVEQALAHSTDEDAQALWHLRFGDRELSAEPRITVWRSLMFNQWIHHRGQLCVYLRLLDLPVPAIYGPSADERLPS
jgi:uncharacterized damage-inducible protein DinB